MNLGGPERLCQHEPLHGSLRHVLVRSGQFGLSITDEGADDDRAGPPGAAGNRPPARRPRRRPLRSEPARLEHPGTLRL